MMKIAVALWPVGAVVCQRSSNTNANTESFAHQSVFDYLKVLTNPEIYALVSAKDPQWPVHTGPIEPPGLDCARKQFPGVYADPATQCQTFHRCDVNGNLTFVKDENFGNRRLYQSDLPLFDTPADSGNGGGGGANGNWVWVQPNTANANGTWNWVSSAPGATTEASPADEATSASPTEESSAAPADEATSAGSTEEASAAPADNNGVPELEIG